MERSIKFIYDIPYIKEIIGYLLIPFLIFIIICSSILLIYSKCTKDHENPLYKYRINLASLIVSILLIMVFLAILVGFSIAFNEQLKTTSNTVTLSYFVIASPIIPIIAILILFAKMIRLMKNKPSKKSSTPLENLEVLDTKTSNNEEILSQEIKKDNTKDKLEVLTEKDTPKLEVLEEPTTEKQNDPIKIPINEQEELIIIPDIPEIKTEEEKDQDIEVL